MNRTIAIAALLVGCAPGEERTPEPEPGCHEVPADADRVRKVVVAHPYDDGGHQADTWAVWELSEDGALSDTDVRFELGRGFGGEVVFTPDGEIGIAVNDDGTLGVFRFVGDDVEVVDPAFGAEQVYASRVRMDPSGAFAWVVDGNWRENGGGVYRLDLACDGTPSLDGPVIPGQTIADVLLDPADPDRAIVPAANLLDSGPGDNAFLVDLAAATLTDGAAAFPDADAIVAGAALTHDGAYALIGDNSAYSGIDNRIAVLSVDGDALTPVQVVTPIEDPVAVVASPFDRTALVASGFGDALYVLTHDDAAPDAPYTAAEVDYVGGRPELPAGMALVSRGALAGTVLLAENTAIRALRFEPDGGVTDLGAVGTGSGLQAVTGAIGVQP